MLKTKNKSAFLSGSLNDVLAARHVSKKIQLGKPICAHCHGSAAVLNTCCLPPPLDACLLTAVSDSPPHPSRPSDSCFRPPRSLIAHLARTAYSMPLTSVVDWSWVGEVSWMGRGLVVDWSWERPERTPICILKRVVDWSWMGRGLVVNLVVDWSWIGRELVVDWS